MVLGYVHHYCTIIKISRECSPCHGSWIRRPCHPSHAKISQCSTTTEKLLFHDPQSCSKEPRKQVSALGINLVWKVCQVSFNFYKLAFHHLHADWDHSFSNMIFNWTESFCSVMVSRNLSDRQRRTTKSARMQPLMHWEIWGLMTTTNSLL